MTEPQDAADEEVTRDEGEEFDATVSRDAAGGESELAYLYGGNDFIWDSAGEGGMG